MASFATPMSVLMICLGLSFLPSTLTSSCQSSDADGDGWSVEQGDCDDQDPAIHPEATEVCDSLDNDCDDQIDEGVLTVWYSDLDGDGYGGSSDTTLSCAQPDGRISRGGDCNDQDASIHPGVAEVCDGVDNDCNGMVDEGATAFVYPDRDGDGFGLTAGQLVVCPQPAGYTSMNGDCDDSSPLVYPAADEVCNGLDDDCDLRIDQGLTSYYADRDGDGFGSGAGAPCASVDASRAARGDCDDARVDVYPGASDAPDDGVDQDCGGTTGADSSVGLDASAFTSIQAALDAAQEGSTVWVGPGVYLEHQLTWRGRAIALESTGFAGATVIDAEGQGPVVTLLSSEGPETVLDGFTITGGLNSGSGGGIAISRASPTIARCLVIGNASRPLTADETTGEGGGGGLAATHSSATVTDCLVTGNEASRLVVYGYPSHCPYDYCPPQTYAAGGIGGGMFLYDGAMRITGCTVTDNRGGFGGGGMGLEASSARVEGCILAGNHAPGGGGLFLWSDSATVDRCIISENAASYSGGGVVALSSSATLSGCTLRDNVAGSADAQSAVGGGLYLITSQGTISSCLVAGNRALGQEGARGGGLYLTQSSPTITHCRITDNSASGSESAGGGLAMDNVSGIVLEHVLVARNTADQGGGVWAYRSSPLFSQAILAGNDAGQGGGLYLVGSESSGAGTRVFQSILAHNGGDNVHLEPADPAAFSSSWSDLFDEGGTNGVTLDPTDVCLEPGFLAYEGGEPTDFHLSSSSPLIDAGQPGATDVDGTRADPGLYGGAGGGGWDMDGDGFPDWFWPGTIDEAPAGFSSSSFDCEDGDADLQNCVR